MRPLKLKLQGLRSYRQEQEVDFEGAGLVAIVGDTGAGKSSLLEAITVALYGTCTWDGKETKQLISDGLSTMQVGLTFRADDKVWRVERAISRGTYPPARHTLECLDGGERLDKKDAVDARIRHLVGLDYDAFLRSVVLPQGRFAALLQAKPGERASILKGILRIDRLDSVREEAKEARERMSPVVDALRQQRSALLPDPAAAELDASQRVSTADQRRTAIQAARSNIQSERDRGRAAEDRRRTLEALLARAAEGRVTGAGEGYRALARRDAEIAAALVETDAVLAAKRGEEDELVATIEEAEQKGAGPVSLGNAKNGLKLIADELPLLAAEAEGIEREDAALSKDTADLDKADAMLAAFSEAESDAKKARDERQTEARQAAEALENGKRLQKELRTAEAEETKALKKAEKARGERDKAQAELETAGEAAKKAESKLEEAESGARAAAQKHAAHHAAAGSRAGDPCPVCERPLPEGFAPPRATAVETAQKKLEKARKDHDEGREKLTVCRARVEAAATRAAEADSELAERTAHSAHCRESLATMLPGAVLPGAAPPAATTATDETAILAGAQSRHDAAARALAEAESHVQKTRDVVTRAKAELDGARKRLNERKSAHKKAKDTLSTRRERLQKTVSSLPKDLQPREPFQAADIAALVARVDLRKSKIEAVLRSLEETRTARRAVDHERLRLAEQRQKEVVSGKGDLDVRLATFAERLALLAAALPEDPPSPRPESATLAELAAWATELEQAEGTLTARGDTALSAARAAGRDSAEQTRRLLAEAGAESEAALDQALSRAEGQHAAATADLDRARADKPLAAALDERIERAQGLVAALTEVTRLVADGKLIGHVVHRKQRVLLAVASELLGSMTRSRYGFSEDFDVVDRLSGLSRGTRTLSGGETFLASLALSLALVELAGRAGGRLEALFLDEGFGSLDASSLGEALDTLTQKAEGGRLVAVISHLKSVAESIDRVLAVKMSPTGSHVTWISAAERERMLTEDVERGLVS